MSTCKADSTCKLRSSTCITMMSKMSMMRIMRIMKISRATLWAGVCPVITILMTTSSTCTNRRSTARLHVSTSPPSMSTTWEAVRTGGGQSECAQHVETKSGCERAAEVRSLGGNLHTSFAACFLRLAGSEVAFFLQFEFLSRHCGEKLGGLIDLLTSLSLSLLVTARFTRSLGFT